MARQLFLALSAEKGGGPGEYAASARHVRDWLAARRIDAPGLSIENGSGLSRTDRIARPRWRRSCARRGPRP